MIRPGQIVKVEKGALQVEVPVQADCGECSGCGICEKNEGRTMVVPVAAAGGESVGDRVRVDVETPNAILGALTVFGLPLIGIFIGGAFGYYGSGQEFWAGIGALAGFVASFGLIALLSRYCSRLAVHARIVSPDEGQG